MASRRLNIRSLLCDDDPPSDPGPSHPPDQIVPETVVLAPHLATRKPATPSRPSILHPPSRTPVEQSLDALAHVAALAEKQQRDHRSDASFPRAPARDTHIQLNPVEEHRMHPIPHFPPPPPPRHILEQQQQQQQQQQQHHLRLLQQQQHQHQLQQQHQREAQQREARREQMIQQERVQAQLWERERGRGHVPDVMGFPADMQTGRKPEPGQIRPLSSPSPSHPYSHFPHHQMEPPNKKRRSSDSYPPAANEAMSLSHAGGRSILNPEPGISHNNSLASVVVGHRPSSSSGLDAAQFGYAVHRPRVTDASHGVVGPPEIHTPPASFFPGRRSPPGSVTGRAKAARKSDPEPSDVIPPRVAEQRDYTVIHVPERPRDEYVVDDRKHKKPHAHPPPATSRPVESAPAPAPSLNRHPDLDTRPHGPPQRRPQPAEPPPPPPPPPSARKAKEEDAHDWLLEQFSPSPLDTQAKRKPEPTLSPSPSPPATPHVYKAPSPVQTKKPTSPLVPATMPDAAKALEEELAAVVAAPPHKVEAKDDEMDVDILVKETLEDDKRADAGQMEVDVEDELLSLIDDKPLPPSVSRVSSGGTKPAPKLPSSVDVGSRPSSPSTPMLPPSERGSIPPAATGTAKESGAGAKKKKESTKPPPKPKAPAASKPRAKLTAKSKAKASEAGAAPAAKAKAASAISRKSGSVAAASSRSRSTSAMPGGSVGPEGSEKPDDEEEEVVAPADDDKLYCICKTTYDEDRFMIACDKCDEWYHTQCVDMPDLVVDLVDQFFCPPCIAKNPKLSLKTTYKPRCRNGLDHPEPDSPKACHKPAQGALSKFCSAECGYSSAKKRIEEYQKRGGKKELLWESVKNAQKREAVVVLHEETVSASANGGAAPVLVTATRMKPIMEKVEREVASLNAVLEEVVTQREELRQGMDMIAWRERLLDLASERADQVGQCGWDQRLCFGEDEWAEFGESVLESYEDAGESEEWWCLESEHCERHAGWQTIRMEDTAKEKEKKEDALFRLTTREREIRKRIEDIVEPFNRSCINPTTTAPLKSSKLVNGNTKGKANGDNKKGKKRKNPS